MLGTLLATGPERGSFGASGKVVSDDIYVLGRVILGKYETRSDKARLKARGTCLKPVSIVP